MEIKKQVANILQRIEGDNLTERQLDAVYENAEKHRELDETDREIILDSITRKLWADYPARAKKRFGARESFAHELLQPVLDTCKVLFDLTSNRVLNKVKIGGDMRKGAAFVDVYISYKDTTNRRLLLDVRQETSDRLPMCSVNDVVVGSDEKGTREEFHLGSFAHAADLYVSKLREMLATRESA